jgi:CubicO group peptidase (beta-lactamase class C family)
METRLAKLRPLIEELFELSGSPGLSLGVLHHGVPAYTAHFGRRQASQAAPPNDDTLYNVASMTKLMTAGVISNLVEEGLLGWDVPVRHYLPELGERKDDIGQHATVTDFLANRTGLSAQSTFWGVMFEDILPDREQIPRLACHIPAIGEFRKTFVYSTWGYGIVTCTIERVTGLPFSTCVEKYIFRPLGMSRSTTNLPAVDNVAYRHWVGLDSVAHEFPWSEYRGWSDDTGFGGAAGARSSTRELLIMYQSLLHAYDHQTRSQVDSTPGSPFKYVRRLLSPHIGVANVSPERLGYCLGTYRTRLPGNLSFASYNSKLLKKTNDQPFGIKHDGREIFCQVASFTGYNGFMLLDPQSQSAIFVVVNSLPLFDITDILGKLLLETILEDVNPPDYIELGKAVKKNYMLLYDAYTSGLQAKKTGTPPSFPLKDYEGDYWNETKIMCYSVHVHGEHQIRVSAKGSYLTSYVLESWGGDMFCLPPNRDLELSQSMWPFTPLRSRIFTFNCNEKEVLSFDWHHDATHGSEPETFSKTNESLHPKL